MCAFCKKNDGKYCIFTSMMSDSMVVRLTAGLLKVGAPALGPRPLQGPHQAKPHRHPKHGPPEPGPHHESTTRTQLQP